MISNAASLNSLVSSMNNLNQRQTDISAEISSGLRITHLSDDAAAAGQAIRMANSLAADNAFISTASAAGNRMQAADSALSSVVTQLTSGISTATAAFNDSTSATARTAAAQQLSSLRSSLLSLANSSYGGSYLFSGSGKTQPFNAAASGTVAYSGDAVHTSVSLSGGGTLQTSLAGSDVFTSPTGSVFGALDNAIAALSAGDTSQASTLVGALTAALGTVTTQRAVLNTSQSRLSAETDFVTADKTNLSVEQSSLLSANTATLATELSRVTTQQSALLSTISIVQKGSLFDYMS